MIDLKIEFRKVLIILIVLFCCIQHIDAAEEIRVFAAASTTGPLMEIVKNFQQDHDLKIKTSFASSGALIRQIEHGADADIYISASLKWADYASEKDLIDSSSRRDFLANTLVLITPADAEKTPAIEFTADYPFSSLLQGRLAIGNPEHVPAGKYARQALESLTWWTKLADRLILSKDVRATLRVVEKSEAEFGIVYGSDAKKSTEVRVAGTFPPETHKPIVYVLSTVKGAASAAEEFINYLLSEPASAVFAEYGFVPK